MGSQNWLISFFLIFCMMLDSYKVRKVTKLDFSKKSRWIRNAQKVPKMAQKWGNPFRRTFFLEYESTIDIVIFCKTHVWEKFGSWVKVQKTPRPIRMQFSSNCNISQTNWSVKLNFFVWLDIHRSNKFIQTFQVGVVSHAKMIESKLFMSQKWT